MGNLNKYGVPHHTYTITLDDGTSVHIDIGVEEDWGNIQEAFGEEDGNIFIGYGNDNDGHRRIVKIVDDETEESLDVDIWAEYVWSFSKNYSC